MFATSPFKMALQFSHMIVRSEEHTSELQSQSNLVCRLLLEKKKPLCSVAEGCVVRTRRVAAPAVPCAVNVPGLTVRHAAVAVGGVGPAGARKVPDVSSATPW